MTEEPRAGYPLPKVGCIHPCGRADFARHGIGDGRTVYYVFISRCASCPDDRKRACKRLKQNYTIVDGKWSKISDPSKTKKER